MVEAEVDLHKRTPLGPLRLANEVDAGFGGSAVGLLGVTADAGADNVLPGRGPAAVARDDVVKIQIFAVEFAAAILAGVLVALKDVVARKFDFLLGQAVEEGQKNDPRHANAK